MSGKRVLVLCQRKQGIQSRLDVKDTIVPMIHTLVDNIIGAGATIEYLSKLTQNIRGVVDYDFELNNVRGTPDIEKTNEFIERNRKQFSMIIMNTCPVAYINFNIIEELLDDNGYVILALYPKSVDRDIDALLHHMSSAANASELFTTPEFDETNQVLISRKRSFVPEDEVGKLVQQFGTGYLKRKKQKNKSKNKLKNKKKRNTRRRR